MTGSGATDSREKVQVERSIKEFMEYVFLQRLLRRLPKQHTKLIMEEMQHKSVFSASYLMNQGFTSTSNGK